MSVFDNSRAVTNQTMWNEPNFDVLGKHKLSFKPTKIPLSQQNTIDKRNNYNCALRDIPKIQAKLENNLYKLELRSGINQEKNYSDATTATASHDERKISMYLRALEEVGKANPEIRSLSQYIIENIEKSFHSLIYKTKEKNEQLADEIEAVKKELKHEK